MRYKYDIDNEYFVREDGLGKKFHINITEARRIMTLSNLGNTAPEIRSKINFNSRKVYESTINNFINQVKKGNISLEGDYPAPKIIFEDLTLEERINQLEERVKELEDKECGCRIEHKLSWRERLGL